MKRGLLLTYMLFATLIVANSAVLRIEGSPQQDAEISNLSKIAIHFNLDEIQNEHPDLENLGIASASKKNETNPSSETAVKLYKGQRENGELISAQFENRTPTSDSFETGCDFNIYFDNIELDPNEDYYLYVYYSFYAATSGTINSTLKKETAVTSYTYDSPYIVRFRSTGNSIEYVDVVSVIPTDNSRIDAISNVVFEFNDEISELKSEGVVLTEMGSLVADPIELKISNEDKNSVCVIFNDIALYNSHNYTITLPEGCVKSVKGAINRETKVSFRGADWKALSIGRTNPRNESTVLSLTYVEIPIVFPDGYGFVNKSSTPLEYKGYIYLDDKSSEPLQELTFKVNSAATGITSSFWVDLEPSKKYTVFVPKGQIMPEPFDNVVNKYSDTSNGDIYLNFYTPTLESIPSISLVDNGKEFTVSALDGKMRFDLEPFVFDDEQYRIVKWSNLTVADLYEIGNTTPIAQINYDVINEDGKSYIEFPEDTNVELLDGKDYELVFEEKSLEASFGTFSKYTYSPRFVIKYKGETATEHTLVIKSSDGHSMETVLPRHQSMTLKFTPSDNWIVTDVLHNEVSKGAVDAYTIDDLTENTTIEVQHGYQGNIAFEFTTDVNSIEVDGTNYVVSREGEMIVISGLNKTEIIRVYSMGGQVLFTESATNEVANISLPSGIYVITINDGTNEVAFKVKH